MLTEFEREELDRLKAAADKGVLLKEQKDHIANRSFRLTREANRCQAVANMFASQPFQSMLSRAFSTAQEFQALIEDYTEVPARKDLLIQRLQVGNSILEANVHDLRLRMEEEQLREDSLEASMQAFQRNLDQLFDRKAVLEKEVIELKRQVREGKEKINAMLQSLACIEGLSREEQEWLHFGQLDYLIYQLRQYSTECIEVKRNVLVQITQRFFHLNRLRDQHESAQRLFSNYSSCQSEHDLINEEQTLTQQIDATRQRIKEQRQGEERALKECEGAALAEARRQAEEWIGRRLQELGKKKKVVEACLEMVVAGSEEEELEVRELRSELWRLQEEEKEFRKSLNQRSIQI